MELHIYKAKGVAIPMIGVNKNVSNTITKLYKLPGTIEYCIFN